MPTKELVNHSERSGSSSPQFPDEEAGTSAVTEEDQEALSDPEPTTPKARRIIAAESTPRAHQRARTANATRPEGQVTEHDQPRLRVPRALLFPPEVYTTHPLGADDIFGPRPVSMAAAFSDDTGGVPAEREEEALTDSELHEDDEEEPLPALLPLGEEDMSGDESPDYEDDQDEDDLESGDPDKAEYDIPEEFSQDAWGRQNFQNLYDLLRGTELPVMPDPYSPVRLTSTKDTTQAERDIAPGDRLTTVVVCPSLLDDLEEGGTQLLSEAGVERKDIADILDASRFLPRATHAVMPKVIFSEGDVVAWCESTMFRPSIECVLACLDPNWCLLRRARFAGRVRLSNLNLSSVPSQDINADRVIWEGTRPVDIVVEGKPATVQYPQTLCSIEIKSPNVFTETCFSDLNIPLGGEGQPSTFAMRFAYPLNNWNPKKTDRIIVQAWAQMVNEKCKYGIITCHTRTIFLIRSGQTLYVSRTYYSADSTPQFWIFCLMMLAKGKLNLTLPQYNTDHWPAWASVEHEVVRQGNARYIGMVKQTTWNALNEPPRREWNLRPRQPPV